MFEHAADAPIWRRKIEAFVTSATIQNFIVFLIVLNAILLGLETDPEIVESIGRELAFIDHAILFIFTIEILLLMASRGFKYFLDPWCIFDFLVVSISLVPATESLSVLRSLRVLRVLRLINKVESMKRVVSGLLTSLPGLGSVFGLILIIFYVSGVIATNEFGKAFPEYFGSLSSTFFTLFQVMTLESWSDGVARPVMEKFPYAWIFFVLFILVATFIVVNLFIAVIVDSLTSSSKENVGMSQHQHHPTDLEQEVRAMRQEIGELKALLEAALHKL